MTTKHQPATPLPWKSVSGCLNPDFSMTLDPSVHTADTAYIAHAANAYPRLVEAVRGLLAKDGWGVRTAGEQPARALLRELGEE